MGKSEPGFDHSFILWLGTTSGRMEIRRQRQGELYNIAQDPSETQNLAPKEAERAKELKAKPGRILSHS